MSLARKTAGVEIAPNAKAIKHIDFCIFSHFSA